MPGFFSQQARDDNEIGLTQQALERHDGCVKRAQGRVARVRVGDDAAHAERADTLSNSCPMPPPPTMPSVRPTSPVPIRSLRSSQRPARVMRSLANRRPASANSRVSVATATGRRIASGVLVRTMPLELSAATSTES